MLILKRYERVLPKPKHTLCRGAGGADLTNIVRRPRRAQGAESTLRPRYPALAARECGSRSLRGHCKNYTDRRCRFDDATDTIDTVECGPMKPHRCESMPAVAAAYHWQDNGGRSPAQVPIVQVSAMNTGPQQSAPVPAGGGPTANASSQRLASILSQCEDFWMTDQSHSAGQQAGEHVAPGAVARDAAYRRLIGDLIKQQIDRDASSGVRSATPSRIEQYLDEYVDISFGDSTLLELMEHEFIARHENGGWPDIEEYVRQFPKLESEVRQRLESARDDVVTYTSVRSVLRDSTATSAADETSDVSQSGGTARPDTTELAETLREIKPFSDLSRHVREAIAAHARVQAFEPGDELLRQGEAADALFILLEGTADVWLNDSGQLHPIAQLQRHTVVGELGLVTQEVRSATVTATSQGCAAIIGREAFEHVAGRYPRLSIALAELIAERVGTLAIDVLCGKVIDGYLIRQRLGRGATGIVYAALDTKTQQPVALKMLRHDLTFDRHASLRFHQEAEIISQLEHPNIVAVLSEFSAYGTSFIAMDLCDGPSLTELISRHGRLPIPLVQAIVGQLAAGLICAHKAGIAHRDLKPSNVLLTSDGAVKIVDFGLARYLSAEEPGTTAFGQIVGTPRYMAPEQLAGERGDSRSDLYALGCIAYELLNGRPMFVAGRFSELLIERAKWTLPASEQIREGLPPVMYNILASLLESDPEDRTCDLRVLAGWAAPVGREWVTTEAAGLDAKPQARVVGG